VTEERRQAYALQRPVTLEAVTQAMRRYLAEQATRIGPDFDGWVAYHLRPSSTAWANRMHPGLVSWPNGPTRIAGRTADLLVRLQQFEEKKHRNIHL
jgi:hypothetical protein